MDAELLERWRAGDPKAGQELFSRHFEAIYRFFANKCDEPDELVQSTFLACLRARDQFRQESGFRTYLFAIARNELYGFFRKHRRHAVVEPELSGIAAELTTAATKMAKSAEHRRLLEALRKVPLAQQTLLELHYWEGLDAAALAEVFETTPAAIRVRLHRARQDLREHLKEEPDDLARAATPASQSSP
jgi:RNA polymerase sigma-70 factor (ECF subfamily)